MDQSRFLSLFQSVRVKVVKKYVVDLPGFLWAKTRYIEQNNHMHFTFAYVLVVCQHEKTFHCRYLEYYVDTKLVIIPDSAL